MSIFRMIDVKSEISFNDLVLMVMIIIEFFQYVSTGPDFKSLSEVLHSISIVIAVDIT